MLSDHGIYDVKVMSVKGQLSDHYNPQKKTVNLSESVYKQEMLPPLLFLRMNAVMQFSMQKGMVVEDEINISAYGWCNFKTRYIHIIWRDNINAKFTSFR